MISSLLICPTWACAVVFASPAMAGGREPDISPVEAQMLLSATGLNVGTVRRVGEKGNFRVDGLKFSAEGRWIVIRVLATRVKGAVR